MSTMAEVLAAHVVGAEYSAGEALELICTCGLRGDKQTHAEHVADALTKAGYGKLAEAWDEGADAEFQRSVMKRAATPNPFRSAS